jgi:hypothetical protein
MIKERCHCCNGLHPLWHSGQLSESGLAHLGLSARGETGEWPGGGGARELALEVGVPIWGVGSGGLTVAGLRW